MTTTTHKRMTNALEAISKQRTLLILDHPFFGSLSLQLKLIEDAQAKRTKMMATDGRAMFYHAPYVDSISDAELMGLLAKTCMHPAMLHHVRRGNRDEVLWNKAATNAIVGPLKRAGFVMPAGVEYDARFDGQSAEQIYSTMQQEQPQQQAPEECDSEQQQSGDSDDDSESDDESDDADGEAQGEGSDSDDESESAGSGSGSADSDSQGNGSGSGQGDDDFEPQTKDMPGAVLDAPDKVEDTANWEMATKQAAQAAQMMGELPEEFARMIAEAQRPRFDARALLMRFAQEQCKSDYSWKRPNIRYIQQGVYLPAVSEPAMGGIALVIDSSGSITDEIMGRFLGICQTVVDQVRPRFVRVIVSDARVHADHRFERDEMIEGVKLIGGGGTDFRPAFNLLADDSDDAPACIMYLTDGYGTYPNEADCCAPTLWCMTTDVIAPHGETVRLEEGAR